MQNRCGPTAQKRATQIRSLYDPGIPKFYLSLYQPSTLTAACPTEPLTPQPLKRAKRAARTRAPFPLPSRRPLQRHTWDCVVVEHLYLSLALKQNYIYIYEVLYISTKNMCVCVENSTYMEKYNIGKCTFFVYRYTTCMNAFFCLGLHCIPKPFILLLSDAGPSYGCRRDCLACDSHN